MNKFKDVKRKFASRKGFTLVELVVVIAVLAILAGVGTAAYSGYITKAKEASDIQVLAAVKTAADAAAAAADPAFTVNKIEITVASNLATDIKIYGSDASTLKMHFAATAPNDAAENGTITSGKVNDDVDFGIFLSGNTVKLTSEKYSDGATWAVNSEGNGQWSKKS